MLYSQHSLDSTRRTRRGWPAAVLGTAVALALSSAALPPTAAQAIDAHQVTGRAGATLTETEDNHDDSSADLMPLGDTMTGQASKYSMASHPYTDYDWFYTPVAKAGRLAIDFTFPREITGNAYTLTVKQGDWKYNFELTGGDADGARVKAHAIFVSDDPVYVEIKPRGQNVVAKEYSLRLDVTPTFAETEPNNDLSKADWFTEGQTISGSSLNTYNDHDYFVMNVDRPGPYSIKLAYPASITGRAYDLELYNSDGNRLTSFKLDGSHASGAWLASQNVMLPQGQVFFRVSSDRYRSSRGQQYRLTVTRTPKQSFTDVPRGHQFYREIQWMYESGATTGIKTSSGLEYRPKTGVSREAMAAFMYRLDGAKTGKPARAPFIDVPKSYKFGKEIAWMKSTGLTTGGVDRIGQGLQAQGPRLARGHGRVPLPREVARKAARSLPQPRTRFRSLST